MLPFFYITGPVGATPAKVFTFDPVAGQSTQIPGFSTPSRLGTNRQGDVYVLDDRTIYRVDPGAPAGTVPDAAASQGVTSLVFDDFIDLLCGVNPATGMLYQWHVGLGGAPFMLPMPAGMCLSGRVSLAISPADHSLWVCGDGCFGIYKIIGGGANPLTIADMITLAPGSHPTGLNVNRQGHVLFSSNGHLVEMEKDANGLWINSPVSDFAGVEAGPAFYLSRSRTNFDPATMAGPGSRNLPDPQILPEVLDCYANCDGSTTAPVLNVNDFTCFLNQFAAGDLQANCDESTTPPVLNVNDFTCFLNKFAAGCP
jgi:hypothetical protein